MSVAVNLAEQVVATDSAAPSSQGRPFGKGKLADHPVQLIARVEVQPHISILRSVEQLKRATEMIAYPASLSGVLLKAGFRI